MRHIDGDHSPVNRTWVVVHIGSPPWLLSPFGTPHLLWVPTHQLGFGVLVKQLRTWDINGTPLLCLAASSRSEATCFQMVHDKLRTVLGEGERLHLENITKFGKKCIQPLSFAHTYARGFSLPYFKLIQAALHTFYYSKSQVELVFGMP